jgi:hypothetical protein
MCSRGVLVHCPGRLGAAAAVLAAELQCGDGVFTAWAHERSQTVDHFDGVMSHSFKYSRLSRYDSELKLPSPPVTSEMRYYNRYEVALGVEALELGYWPGLSFPLVSG